MHGMHGVTDVFQDTHSHALWIFIHFETCVQSVMNKFFMCSHGIHLAPGVEILCRNNQLYQLLFQHLGLVLYVISCGVNDLK